MNLYYKQSFLNLPFDRTPHFTCHEPKFAKFPKFDTPSKQKQLVLKAEANIKANCWTTPNKKPCT